MTLDRQQAFSRHQGSGAGVADRRGAARNLSHTRGNGLCRSAHRQAIQGRPVESDLSVADAGAALRSAPQAAGQAAAVGARGRPRIPRHPCALCARLSGGRAAHLLRRRERRRHGILRDGLRRRPRVLGAADAGIEPGRARRGLQRHERHHRAAASFRSGGYRLGRFRARRKLRRAPDRALVEAIPRLGDREDRRHGAADRMAAEAYSAGRAGAAGARRLPARQSDRRQGFCRRSSPCSTGNCRRSATHSPISPIT